MFSTSSFDKAGNSSHLDLFSAASVEIIRHVKIKAAATPYDPAYADYFELRSLRKPKRLLALWEDR